MLCIYRRHIKQDIMPYTCILHDCPHPETLYITREEWNKHIQRDHETMKYWLCTLCLNPEKFDKRDRFIRHLQEHHKDDVPMDRISSFVRMATYSTTISLTSCPLCPPGSMFNYPQDGQGEVSPDAMFRHVAEHTHSFSLYSLPWLIPGYGEQKYLGLAENDVWDESKYFKLSSEVCSADSIATLSDSDSEARRRDFEAEGLPAPVFSDEGLIGESFFQPNT